MTKSSRRWLLVILGGLFMASLAAAGIYVHTTHYVEGFAEVVPGRMYRSRQPRGEQWDVLGRHHIRAVVDLRPEGEDAEDFREERQACQAAGAEFVNIPIGAPLPDYDQIRQFIQLARSDKTPILVHCEHGRSRTGYMIATYRVVVEGWSPAKAWDEICRHSNEPGGEKKDNLMDILNTLDRDRAAWRAKTDPAVQTAAATSPAK